MRVNFTSVLYNHVPEDKEKQQVLFGYLLHRTLHAQAARTRLGHRNSSDKGEIRLYGCWNWRHARQEDMSLPVTTLSPALTIPKTCRSRTYFTHFETLEFKSCLSGKKKSMPSPQSQFWRNHGVNDGFQKHAAIHTFVFHDVVDDLAHGVTVLIDSVVKLWKRGEQRAGHRLRPHGQGLAHEGYDSWYQEVSLLSFSPNWPITKMRNRQGSNSANHQPHLPRQLLPVPLNSGWAGKEWNGRTMPPLLHPVLSFVDIVYK